MAVLKMSNPLFNAHHLYIMLRLDPGPKSVQC